MLSEIHLYIAPAGAGKTTFVLKQARAHARDWGQTRVVVGSSRQMIAANRRLAALDGALGVRIHTLSDLARDLLDRTGSSRTLISDPIQVRFLRSLVDEAHLDYYAPLARMPGFIRALRGLFAELTYDLITPSDFGRQVRRMGEPARLAELARLYALYQQRMAAKGWMDSASLLLWAQEAAATSPGLIGEWEFLGVDGFMAFRPAELALLKAAAVRARTVIITLTGDLPPGEAAATLFDETIARTQAAFGVAPEPLPELHPVSRNQPFSFVAAPDTANEARVALRWLKERLVLDGLKPAQVALLARDIGPYRDVLRQTADEFGLPVQISGGFPLRGNPAVDAFISLLNLAAVEPGSESPDARFPFRSTVRAWRSPYFDWFWPQEAVRIEPRDADALDRLGRWARVTAGAEQWEDAFSRRLRQLELDKDALIEEGEEPAPSPPGLAEVEDLRRKWALFRAAVTPPQGKHPAKTFVRWLEDLIGAEQREEADGEEEAAPATFSLNLASRIRSVENEPLKNRDIAALVALKEVLRGVVWAAEALHLAATTFSDFLTDLAGALEAARYAPSFESSRGAVQALRVEEAAGLRFQAVALLGLAEGSFPAVLREDTFLRGQEREEMRRAGLAVEPSPRSQEAALFYVAMNRAESQMLLTRPRLARGGAEWQASPYWRALVEAAGVKPLKKRHETLLAGSQVASKPELMLALAAYAPAPVRPAMEAAAGERLAFWEHGRSVIEGRRRRRGDRYDGDLSGLRLVFTRRFGPDHTWSAGRLETYHQCPYRFFADSVLHLQERPEPALGLDNQQLGLIYHRALEEVFYRGADVADDADALIAIWEGMADDLLAEAPDKYGFRPTAWWPQTREQIKETIRRTLAALAAENQGWRPRAFEAAFGIDGRPALVVAHDARAGDALRLRGIIDRVDGDGRGNMRIIDYKRGGVSGYNDRSLVEGEHLQLPIYALAAARALEHGHPVDGFYWSVTQAEASRLRLGKFGVEEAVAVALAHAWEVVEAARAGRFQPQPPKEGCPDFCPAAAFCWHYRPRRTRA